MEDGVVAGADDGVEIAGSSAMRSGVAFSGQADALAVASAGLDAHFERFGIGDRAFAVTGRAHRQILSGPMAARALHIELHAAAGLGDLPAAAALGTFAWRLERALAVAGRADILTGDIEAHHAAAD